MRRRELGGARAPVEERDRARLERCELQLPELDPSARARGDPLDPWAEELAHREPVEPADGLAEKAPSGADREGRGRRRHAGGEPRGPFLAPEGARHDRRAVLLDRAEALGRVHEPPARQRRHEISARLRARPLPLGARLLGDHAPRHQVLPEVVLGGVRRRVLHAAALEVQREPPALRVELQPALRLGRCGEVVEVKRAVLRERPFPGQAGGESGRGGHLASGEAVARARSARLPHPLQPRGAVLF